VSEAVESEEMHDLGDPVFVESLLCWLYDLSHGRTLVSIWNTIYSNCLATEFRLMRE
jgi:hypothetical protein